MCNLLVREQRAEIEGLVELGDLLRQAQEDLAGRKTTGKLLIRP